MTPKTSVLGNTRHVLVLLVMLAISLAARSARAANGIMLDVVVHEILAADPVENAVIDSVTYPVFFDRKTTLRAGNFVVDVLARPNANGSIALSGSFFVSGPLPGNKSDEADVMPGAALIVNDIRGKGKSSYRARLIPRPADLDSDTLSVSEDSLQWEPMYALRMQYMLPKGVLPPMQFLPVRGVLDYEFDGIVDTFQIDAGGRLLVYLAPGRLAGWPVEPEYGYAIDQSRYRVVATHDPLNPRVRTRALLMTACYRVWGYAPPLLASGFAGYPDFSDYDVKNDHAAGHRIPLDSLARTLDYKRYDRQVADHHAESFVAWLINTYGTPRFKDVYERATDLSIHRAIWSVYGHTLAELEKQWLDYLSKRKFYREEFDYFAKRAAAFHDFESHLALLKEAAALESPHQRDALRDIGIACGQLGRWDDAVAAFQRLLTEYPEEKQGRWLLAEAQRASGDDIAALRTYTDLLKSDPSDPQTFLRLGEIQWEKRRVDSAATLWRQGLSCGPGPMAGSELCLRMGHYFQERKHGRDSAEFYFSQAKRAVSGQIMNNPTNATAWAITAEALLGRDSVVSALEHLAVGKEVADSPVDLGRIRLLRGQCFDKLDRRSEAIAEYDAIIAGGAEAPVVRLARKYLNRAYGR
jgi:tetratricopeptide (TPR) repeat protein